MIDPGSAANENRSEPDARVVGQRSAGGAAPAGVTIRGRRVQRSFRTRLRRRAINPARPVASSIIDAGSGTAVVEGSFNSIRMAPASKQEVMPGRRHSAPVVSAIACPAKIVLSEPCHGLSGRQFDAIVPVVSAQAPVVGVIRVADPHMESTRLIEDR